MKGKGERERYIQLNAEFQGTARRDKKAFLSEQCREVEENIIMGKIRNLFKKIGDTKGISHAKMATIRQKWRGPNRSRRQGRKGKIYPTECRVPENSKGR